MRKKGKKKRGEKRATLVDTPLFEGSGEKRGGGREGGNRRQAE